MTHGSPDPIIFWGFLWEWRVRERRTTSSRRELLEGSQDAGNLPLASRSYQEAQRIAEQTERRLLRTSAMIGIMMTRHQALEAMRANPSAPGKALDLGVPRAFVLPHPRDWKGVLETSPPATEPDEPIADPLNHAFLELLGGGAGARTALLPQEDLARLTLGLSLAGWSDPVPAQRHLAGIAREFAPPAARASADLTELMNLQGPRDHLRIRETQ